MLFFITLVLALLLVNVLKDAIKKYPVAFYTGIAALSVLAACFKFPGTKVITKGTFPGALWVIVMWIGALPNGSKLMKKLMPIRGELSIIAAISTLCHNVMYGRMYFVMLFTKTSSMSKVQLVAAIMSVAMLIIMIPLTIMSFKSVRKKINAKTWKKLQRFAYIFYALLYLHVLILNLEGAQEGSIRNVVNVIAYSIIFIGYLVIRIRKYLIIKKKLKATFSMNLVSIFIFLILIGAIINTAYPRLNAEESSIDSSIQMAQETNEDDYLEEIVSAKLDGEYVNGEYTASAYGYDGNVTMTITIKDNTIVNIEGSTEESIAKYYKKASDKVISQIISTGQTQVDAVTGATYSSEAIMEAVQKALEEAKK